MADIENLLQQVAIARKNFITSTKGLTNEQAAFKSSPEVWSVTDNVEHMFWAEFGGINSVYKAVEGIKNNKPVFAGEKVHHGLHIETIIEKTWREKEEVPETAKPRWGGTLSFWIEALSSLQPQLELLCKTFSGLDPEEIIYPHIISGPLNVIQRLEFLRFHLQRHQQQIEDIKNHAAFPM